jgi:Mg-chelatase subunit ChlI
MKARRRPRAKPGRRRYWSAEVTRRSDALDLEPAVFRKSSARAIAQSLKRSAERSRRRKGTAYQSAMSMLTFYVNRAGRHLPPRRRAVLERAKAELRHLYGRTSATARRRPK